MLRSFFLALPLAGILQASIDLRLPTENTHLYTGQSDQFFMYVDRSFEGQATKPWEGGTFGFVRNASRLGDQIVYTKFHEGIDIAPLHRDSVGNPLDPVSSIAAGRVVHTSPTSGWSNYGKYVVVEHIWDESAYYSLYAHLAEITCKLDDVVQAGTVLGRMGYTGSGLNRARAHVHLEITMLMSRYYDDWHKGHVGGTNRHGLFNGMNLAGLDAARLFVAHKANPDLRISEFISSIPVYFKVLAPVTGTPDFVTRYPWISHGTADGAISWEISFTNTGLPVAFAPSQRKVDAPIVTSILPATIAQRYLTRNLVTSQGNIPTLTSSGLQLVALLTVKENQKAESRK